VTHTDWLPGILVLALGLLAAVVALVLGRGRAVPSGKAEARRTGATKTAEEAELRASRLLDELRELEANRHQQSQAAYQAEYARLESLAADALRARDEARTVAAKPSGPAPGAAGAGTGFFGRHPQLAGALWGAGVVGFLGALFLYLNRDAAPRGANEGLTGTAGRGETAAAPQTTQDPAFDAALARVREDPGDVETSAHVVHELIRRQDYDEARLLTERSLGVDPFQSEARAHRAFLLAVGGDERAAVQQLVHVGELYPNAHEALLFLGLVRMRSGDNPGAVDAFERFLAEAPPDEQAPQMRAALTSLLQQLKAHR
jgi:tetratricopeptide (TPR) repeat protein